LRKAFDRTLNNACGFAVATDKQRIKVLLGEHLAGLFAERVLPNLAQGFAPFLDETPKGALASAVTDKAFIIRKLDVVALNVHRR
jgi:hypothetical protein